MRGKTMVLVLAAALGAGAACGDNESGKKGPYDAIPPKVTIEAPGLSAPVDVVRDSYGIPHIYARSEADAAFANGYVVASDRLLQLELMRHFAKGEVAAIFGALSAEQIDSDLEMRMHRIGPRSQAMYDAMAASTDPDDQGAVTYIRRYADGVNFYLAELRAGKHQLDEAVAVFLDPDRMDDWEPADSVAIGLLQAWSLSYWEDDLFLTTMFERGRMVFDDPRAPADVARRKGAYVDLYPFEPLWKASTIDGWPNYPEDGGTRAKPAPGRGGPSRPRVPLALLDAARATLAPKQLGGVPWKSHLDGSNNWVVGPSLAGGKALLANDPHLSLSNPPVMHAIHITVEGGIDMQGVALAGLPGIILGHNQHIAWGATTAYHDVVDFYLETIVPCTSGGGDCVVVGGEERKITTFSETIDVGALGTTTDSFTATYEEVPGHGPIIPTIDPQTHRLVPRAGNQAISVRYTGYDETAELRAIYKLARATSVDEAFTALDDFAHGAQSWVIVDAQQNFGWTSNARIPRRSPGCFTYERDTKRDGTAPFFVNAGDGSCEWTGFMDPRYVPHAVNPEKGYLATANHDLTGESFDGNPLNGPIVDGAPLYAGGPFPFGSRAGRITDRLETLKASGQPITLDDLASIQADAYSNVGALLRQPLVDVVTAFASPGSGAPDADAWYAALPSARQQRLVAAKDRLVAWSLDTPSAVGSNDAGVRRDASATSIFNAWLVYFLERAFGDELELIASAPDYEYTVAAAYTALTAPEKLVTGKAMATGQALLCDDLGTPGVVESCSLIAAMALDDALTWLEQSGFGTANMDDWRWGQLHRLTLASLAPSADLDIPPADDPDPSLAGGYPRHGDVGSVDASTPGGVNLNFTYGHGPCMRLLVEFAPGQTPVTRFALPGGDVFDRGSAFYRNLMDEFWSRNLYFEFPYQAADVVSKAHERTVFKP
jgi:penicillin amidase